MLGLIFFNNILAIGILKERNLRIFFSYIFFVFIFIFVLYFIDFYYSSILLLTSIISSENNIDKSKDNSSNEKKSLPSEYEICEDYLLELLDNNYLYDNEVRQWYVYNNNESHIWEVISIEDLKLIIIKHLKEHKLIKKNIKKHYLTNIIDFLSTLLKTNFNKFSNQHTNFIPFNNGILNLTTSELLPFSREFKFTYKLNIDFDPEAKMNSDFANWLLFISNKNSLFLDVLRSFFFLIFTRNNSLQVALYLWGLAGTGKSTLEKLMISIVSRNGTVCSNLKRLNNNFETSKLINKNLLLLSDIDQKKADVTKLKLIISGDMIDAERKFEQPFEFFPSCLVMITSNHMWQIEDTTSGIMRRMIYLYFTNVPEQRDPELFYLDYSGKPKGKLSESLPGFINWILANPLENLNLFTKDTSKLNKILSPNAERDSNPLLSWASEFLTYSNESCTPIGNKKSPSNTHLFSNYYKYCLNYGFNPMSYHKFTYSLVDLCTNQFKWKGVIRLEKHDYIGINNISLNLNNNNNTNTNNFLESNINLGYFNGFMEGKNNETISKFKGLSSYPINPYALKPGSTFKLSEYPINPYALSNFSE